MAKKITPQAATPKAARSLPLDTKPEKVQATVPTPLGPADLITPAGHILVNESEYTQLLDLSEKLIDQKKKLYDQNSEYKTDLHTIVECLVGLGPLVGQGGFTPGNIMKLMQNKEKLAAGMKPLFEVIEKYTAPAPVAQLSA